MIMRPTAVAKIANFAVDIFINQRSTNVDALFFCKLFLNGILDNQSALGIFSFAVEKLHFAFSKFFFEVKVLLNLIPKVSFYLEH